MRTQYPVSISTAAQDWPLVCASSQEAPNAKLSKTRSKAHREHARASIGVTRARACERWSMLTRVPRTCSDTSVRAP